MSKNKETKTKTVGPKSKETKSPKTYGRGESPEINLILDQEKQAKSLIEILKRSIVAFDMSMMGAGKTYVASEVALRFGFKNIIVVCPVSVSGKWAEMNKYGLGKLGRLQILSYEGLRSTKSSLNFGEPRLLNHGLLYRKDPSPFEGLQTSGSKNSLKNISPKLPSLNKIMRKNGTAEIPFEESEEQDEVSRTEFFPSEELKEIVKEGCLFIFDEAQKIKNKTAQWLATRCIAEQLWETLKGQDAKSRFLLLSGTPMDKEEHAVNLMQMMGFIKSVKLFNTEPDKSIKLLGAQELINYCSSLEQSSKNSKKNTERAVRLLGPKSPTFAQNSSVKEAVVHLCYKLFQEVIKKEITSSMAPPKPEGVILDAKNGYYKYLEDYTIYTQAELKVRERELVKGLDQLGRMMKTGGFRPGLGIINQAKPDDYINKFGLTKPLKQIENGKVPLFIRKARETLEKIPNSKVCIFVNYLENLAEIAKALEAYTPILMYGSVPKDKRQGIINLFQRQDLKYRLYISITSVSATGIDLDDQSPKGSFPRYAFSSPGFKIDELHQLTRRFYRISTKSNATFRFVYAKGHEEVGLLNNLARKTNVMKETLEKQVEGGVKFPGEYMNEIE